jgi:hypothetical protein
MGEEDWDKPRLIRMPDDLWQEFARAAVEDAHDRDRSTIVRDYVRRYVAAWKGRQPKGDHDGDS